MKINQDPYVAEISQDALLSSYTFTNNFRVRWLMMAMTGIKFTDFGQHYRLNFYPRNIVLVNHQTCAFLGKGAAANNWFLLISKTPSFIELYLLL